jgi:transitional endoplasmic reticulum ATPase
MFLFKKNDNIGKYVVVFPHKEGSYAQTYRVKDENGKVKFLKLIFMEELEVYQYDKDGQVIEVELASSLNHMNLCSFVDSGKLERDGHQLLYVVTEYVKGENLNDRLYRGGTLSPMEIRQVMSALLSAINFIHTLDRPVIHNEITVENIMLDTVGNLNNLKLIDFGAARYADLKPDTESWHGQNLYYVAPERFFGDGSVRSDLFSAGVVLYKLIFGIMPWETNLAGLTLQEQVQAIVEKRNGPLSLPNIQIMEMDNDLLKIMVKALAPDSKQRFASAQEFLDAIERKIEIDAPPISMTRVNQTEEKSKMQPKHGNGFADVAGMSEIKSIMQKKIINILKDPQKAERFKIQIPNGMLLYGPPGCGKSFIAEKFAEEAGYNYVFIKSSDLASIYVHGSQEKIGALFEEARKNAPTILNFDEFEALVPNRSKINNSSESGEVNEFLSQMNNCGKDRIFIIASSNRPDLIDPAILRKGRMDKIIYIPVPDKEARQGIFEIHMKDRPASGDIDYSRLADMTENFVASDIAYIVNDAATRAFEDDVDITQSLLEEVISENNPSVSPNDLKAYEEMRKKMEEPGVKQERPRIGFVQN